MSATGSRLVGTRHARIPASELSNNDALVSLHHAMSNDVASMRQFKRANRNARLAPLSEGEVVDGSLSVPVYDHNVIDLQVVSEEARAYGLRFQLVRDKLWLTATLPETSWRDFWSVLWATLMIVCLVLLAFFVWKPHVVQHLAYRLWRV